MRLLDVITRRLAFAVVATTAFAGGLSGGGATAVRQPALRLASTCSEDSLAPGVAPGPNGTTWFAGGPVVGSFDASGNATQFDLPTAGRSAHEIALGPDGNLWFTENPDPNYLLPQTLPIGPAIGRVTPAGRITEFSIPSHAPADASGPGGGTIGQLDGITAGPDGALWFADPGAASVGRITTGGLVTLFPIAGAALGSPTEITRGVGAKLWYSLPGAVNGVGFITTTGAQASFRLPAASGTPVGLALGPDGDIWVAGTDVSTGNGSITRVTPLGSAKAVYPSAPPVGITAGPDGRLYYTHNELSLFSSGGIDAITTSGVITTFVARFGPVAGDITVGGDGRLWAASSAFGASLLATSATGAAASFAVPEPNLPPAIYTFESPSGVAPQGGSLLVRGERLACVGQVQLGTLTASAQTPSGQYDLGFTAPPQPAGTVVDVLAIGPSGTSPATPGDVLHYVDPPAISALAPSSGQVGTPVRIHGSHLTGVETVIFGGSPAVFRVLDDGDIEALAPQQGLSPTGVVDVQVVDQYLLSSDLTPADHFTYLPG